MRVSSLPRGSQPTCETEGVFGPVTAAIAALAAGDALKLLARGPESVAARFTTVDVWSGKSVKPRRPPAIPIALLRPPRFRASLRPAPCAHQLVRAQRGADS